MTKRKPDDENEAPTTKARKSNQASTSKQAKNALEGRLSQGGKVERFGASVNNHVRQSGAGQIKSVKVTNFMCHSNMSVDFNEHVNFISGPNGSGKSAILQALQYCLGVRATQTGRAQTNAAYLKKGEEVCTAAVTLWNTGPDEDTYEPDLYGPTITIHKTLSAKGSTSTKVLDHRGNKTNITKQDDVRRLLSKLSVNAANPSIVLTQDHARGLLTGNNVNSGLYKLLEESLDYKSTFTYLHLARDDIMTQKEEVSKHKEARKETTQKLDEITSRLKAAEDAVLHIQVAEDLEDHKAWAVVEHIRKKIAECDESLKATPERQAKLQEGLEEQEQKLRDLEARTMQLGQMEQEMSKKVQECTDARENLRVKKKNAMTKKNKINNLIKLKQMQIENAQQEKDYVEQQIAAVRARGDDQESIDRQMAEWHAAHTQAAEAVQASQNAHNDKRKEADDLNSAMTAVQATHQEAQERCNSAKSKVEQATHELHNLQRNSGPHQDAMTFDGQAGFLLDAIHKNKHRFRKPVLGPIGTCLSLEPSADRYSATICAALKHLLPAWIVDNRDDQKILQGLAKNGQEPKVMIMQYDVPPHTDRMNRNQLPTESITTIMNVLRIKPSVEYGHTVMNILIDHGGIERVGLAEDERAGQQILDTPSMWQNLQKLLCNAASGPVEMVRKGKNANIYPWNFAIPDPLLSADKSQIIAARKMNVEIESQHLKEAQDIESQLRQELNAAKQAQNVAANELRKINEQIKQAKQREQAVNRERPEVRASADDELREAIESSENAQAEIARLTPELNDLQEQFDSAKKEVAEAEDERKGHQEEQAKHAQHLEGQLSFIQEADNERQRVQITKDQLLKKLNKADSQRHEAEEEKTKFENVLAQCLEDAQSTCTEEEAKQERPALEQRLMKLRGGWITKKFGSVDKVLDDKDILQQMVKLMRSAGEKLQKQADATADELHTEKEVLEATDGANRLQTGKFEALVSSEMESWQARKDKFYEIRSSVDETINKKFKDMLRTGRNWRGKIEVDHENKLVHLSVTPHKGASTEGAAAVKDMKSLSGGERSFTSVSFVLSLGQEISTPFFAMDEFDVYMDAVNRKVALTSILKFAWELSGTQFILLSPLDMSVVEQSLADVNADIRAQAKGCRVVEEMPSSFINSMAMQPPREGARAHF